MDDVEALIAGEEPLETADRTRVKLESYQRAMPYIQEHADTDDSVKMTRACSTVALMLQGHHVYKRPGGWREGPVFVTSANDPLVSACIAPDLEQDPALMVS